MPTKIMIDAGHGGSDPGAVYNGRLEKNDNLDLALALGDELRRLGYDVEYTRTTDVYDSPVEKARKGNASNVDYFISLHRNSSPTDNSYNGVQTLVYNDAGIKADMARSINEELAKLGFRNINVAERPDLAVLRRTKMPALLVEVGFINSDKDNDLWDANFEEIAKAIAKGIEENVAAEVFANRDSVRFDNTISEKKIDRDESYQILIGIYRGFATASYQMSKVKDEGFDADIYEDDGLFQVRIGRYNKIEDAIENQNRLRSKGYSTLIVNSF